jgi:hypothetical protein
VFVVASVDGRRPRHQATHFLSHGVPEFRVVDGDAEAFEAWRSNDERPALVDQRLFWQPAPGLPPFELDLPVFFLSVADD